MEGVNLFPVFRYTVAESLADKGFPILKLSRNNLDKRYMRYHFEKTDEFMREFYKEIEDRKREVGSVEVTEV
jgi:preprotein translocase subunit SecB